ncbi:MAG: Asp-tRNA(Asn)/Glu-tRNA(Gln) amidotransferase subunit GatC [Pseudonocardiaceae bacterium]
MDAAIGRDDVVRVAHLAHLALTDVEVERFTGQLADVLAYAGEVSAIDAGEGVANEEVDMANPLALINVLREDISRGGLARDEVLAQAPAAESNRFRVPGILGEAP